MSISSLIKIVCFPPFPTASFNEAKSDTVTAHAGTENNTKIKAIQTTAFRTLNFTDIKDTYFPKRRYQSHVL